MPEIPTMLSSCPQPTPDPRHVHREDRPRSSLPPSAAQPYEPTPPARRLAHVRRLHVRGRGRIVVELHGTGRVNLSRGRFDDFCFEGRGLPRHVSSQRVHLDRADGRLVLEGDQLELEFHGGTADVELTGVFEFGEAADPGPSRRSRNLRRAA